ncbi:YhgE/Pip domain-containing protein [Paenibacillus chitinolyticus]|uniref:YhgE/Pip domain-containing protein n=1 Tax=Paenibacillus chitinolyticus TaxID=79263 RepID=UPI00363FD140
MNGFLNFMKSKAVIGGLTMILFYQVAFIAIFMSGYSAIPKNIDELKVAIVNEDTQAGKEIAASLQKELPFHVTTGASLEQAREELNDRDVHMVIHIPADFTEKLSQQNQKAPIDFMINQSNPATVTSTMQSVVTQITGSLNQQFAVQSAQGILQNLNMPEEQAKQLAAEIPAKLAPNMININKVPAGMHNQMAPFFLAMVSYVGAMVFSMMVTGATRAYTPILGRAKAFWYAQGVNALVAFFSPLIGLTIYFLVQGGYEASVFLQVWLVHALELFAAIEFMSIFCYLLKDAAIFANLTLMLFQTISSGAVMTQDMMPALFRWISHISIMYYTVQTDFSLLFGGGKIGENLLGLAGMAIASLVVGQLAYLFVSTGFKKKALADAS